MNKAKNLLQSLPTTREFCRRALLLLSVSITIGLLVALFLSLLELVTEIRWQNPWLIFLLPLAGVFIFWSYKRFGKNSEAGNILIIDEIHMPGGGVPARMAPLILGSTIITHIFGGSAGREGTAVQMGGSVSALFCKWFRIPNDQKRNFLMCGMAAGFGAVFGTPFAGAIFALEVVRIGRNKYLALAPCLIAAVVANLICSATGIHHTTYTITKFTNEVNILFFIHFDAFLLIKVTVAGILFGVVSLAFVTASHLIKTKSQQFTKKAWLIPVIGGISLIGLAYLLGFDYLGLGVSNPDGQVSILSAFKDGGADYFSWLWKMIFTIITLGTGFKGGEVTPLFFIGATLGNTLAVISHSPVSLFAALGFIAVFAGATKTPLACTVMGVELFGANYIIYFAAASFTAYYFSGRSGIYTSHVALSKNLEE